MNTISLKTWLRFSSSVCFCLLLALLAGCASPGTMVDPSAVKQVKVGMTRTEVLRIMGEPKSTVTGPELGRLDNYRVIFETPNSSRMNEGSFILRSLQVFYDASGKVDFVESYESTIPSWRQLDGIPRAGIKGGVGAIPKIERGVTNLYDLTAKLGEPMAIEQTLEGNKTYHWFVFEGKLRNAQLDVIADLVVAVDANRYIEDYRLIEPKR